MNVKVELSSWRALINGRFRVVGHGHDERHCWLDFAEHGKAISKNAATILERFLLGESLKSLSICLDRSSSGVSGIVSNALTTIGICTKPICTPPAFVLFANAAHGKFMLRHYIERKNELCRLKFERPQHTLSRLSPCVRQAIELRFEGKPHKEAAKEITGKAQATIHNQVHFAYHKLGVSNRIELIILLGATEP